MPEPDELLVYDDTTPCPYLPDREARMPLRQPIARLTGEQFDQRLAAGDRRTGTFLYRTQCPSCQACEPIRIPVRDFRPNRSQRRTLRRGDAAITVRVGGPVADQPRADLYNKHLLERGLGTEEKMTSVAAYRQFLVNSCCDTIELAYFIGDTLAAVAIVDRGATALSAVYCCYDADYVRYSLGVYSVLTQIRLAQHLDMDYVYLGLYIEQSPHMNYKTQYRPNERRIDGHWVTSPTATKPDNCAHK